MIDSRCGHKQLLPRSAHGIHHLLARRRGREQPIAGAGHAEVRHAHVSQPAPIIETVVAAPAAGNVPPHPLAQHAGALLLGAEAQRPRGKPSPPTSAPDDAPRGPPPSAPPPPPPPP